MTLDALLVHEQDNESVEGYLEQLEEVVDACGSDVVLANEFELEVEAVVDYKEELSDLAQSKRVNLVLAPENGMIPFFVRPWAEIRGELDREDISWEGGSVAAFYQEIRTSLETLATYLSSLEPNNQRSFPGSVGFYFGEEGQIYAFRKDIDSPLHQVPGTSFSVSICSELKFISPEDLSGVDLLLNPAYENYDEHIRARNSMWSGEGEDVSYLSDNNSKGSATPEAKDDYFNIRSIKEALESQKILSIRSDGKDYCSGVLYLPQGMDLAEYEPQEDFTSLVVEGFDR